MFVGQSVGWCMVLELASIHVHFPNMPPKLVYELNWGFAGGTLISSPASFIDSNRELLHLQ